MIPRLQLLVLLFTFTLSIAYSQNPAWMNNEVSGFALRTTPDGFTYVATQFDNLDGTVDIRVVKLGKNGNTTWIRDFSGSGTFDALVNEIEIDAQKNVYVAGFVDMSPSGTSALVVKYNSNGVLQWSNELTELDNASDIAVDASRNVYVSGVNFSLSTGRDIALARIKSNGDFDWSQTYSSAGADEVFDVAVDGSGNPHLTGVFASGSMVTMKYDENGTEDWVVTKALGTGYAISVDGSGNVYVSGSTRFSASTWDLGTVKMNSNGVEQWVQEYNGTGNGAEGYDGNVFQQFDADGNILVSGYATNEDEVHDAVVLKYASAGTKTWEAVYSRTEKSYDDPKSMAVGANGNIYVAMLSVIPKSSAYVVIVGFDANGNQGCEIQIPSDASAMQLGIDDDGGLYLSPSDFTAKYLCPEGFAWAAGTSGVTVSLNGGVIEGGGPVTRPAGQSAVLPQAWIVGAKGTILYSSDGGAAWTTQTVPAKTPDLFEADIFADTITVAVGKKGTILRTLDSGTTWAAVKNGDVNWTKSDLYSVYAFDKLNGVATGKKGTVLMTSDAGATWSGGPIPAIEKMNDVWFSDTLTGWAVGKKGAMKKTIDGGATWTDLLNGAVNWTEATLKQVAFSGLENGFAVGDKGIILSTNDGGESWITISAAGKTSYTGLEFVKKGIALATGKKGTVAFLEPGGVARVASIGIKPPDLLGAISTGMTELWVFGKKGTLFSSLETAAFNFANEPATELSETPEEYSLYQNFPNPFNPSTTIQFDLGAASNVTLKVFNVLGQEIATLLRNEDLDDGAHEVEFHAGELPSGVYLYRLTAESGTTTYTNVKKLMLVK